MNDRIDLWRRWRRATIASVWDLHFAAVEPNWPIYRAAAESIFSRAESIFRRRCDPFGDTFDRRLLDTEITVRRLRAAGLALRCRTLQIEEFLTRRLGEHIADLRSVCRWTCRAGISPIGDDQHWDGNPSGSLSNKVSPALLRPVTDDITTMPAILPPRWAAPPTAAVVP